MDILLPEIAVAEKILRSVVYGFLLVAFRLAGKRLLGQSFRHKRLEGLVENIPTVIVRQVT
jgi:hypothetical protein